MKHNYIQENEASHYATAVNCTGDSILVQLGNDFGEQIRLSLTRDQAMHFGKMLNEAVIELNDIRRKLKESKNG